MSSVLNMMKRSHGNSVLVKGGNICKVGAGSRNSTEWRLHHSSKKNELSDSTGEPFLVFSRGRFVPGEKTYWLVAAGLEREEGVHGNLC